MITREGIVKLAKDAKRNSAYLIILKGETGINIEPIPVSIKDYWFGSKRIEFISDKYTFDNIKEKPEVLKVLLPDDILKDVSLNGTVNQLNDLIKESKNQTR
ncbi:hypothetical protein L8C07_05425 [Paenibacillus sp. CMAA1739]|uniref:hypothetical protein n=1 Tax=Paenibacillus ottowii TaxID=2315729 RepID=UPI002DBBE980|nr:hypothetical protein [Paenibacillus sp. CMAA1739]MEC4565378.1 hypothetical protein [Paenibacillus sp. CMAA1739]